MSSTMADDKRLTKHGFPKGFRFVPTHLELITILSHKIHGRPLHPKVDRIFHELSILNHHPEELHDKYEVDKEHRYIYFFSWREFQKPAGAGGPAFNKKRQRRGAGGQDEDDNEPRPVRLAKGGGWKPSGGGQVLHWPKDKGGFVAGKMVTMVFYDHREGSSKEQQVKSQWGMHEFTVPVDPRLLSKPTKTTRLHDLALYRLYKLRSDDTESDDGAGSNQTPANVSAAAYGHFSAPAGQPSFRVFTGRNQPPLDTGASTSRMPPPPQQQQEDYIPSFGHPQFYHQHPYGFGAAPARATHHHQYGLGAAPARAAHQQVHTMTMPPAYRTRMPGRQLFHQFERPPGIGLPSRQSFQFTRPPAPSQMPVLPATRNLPSQQAPAKAMYGGAGQEGGHPGATHTLPSAQVSTPPPPADSPAAEELAPMAEQDTAAMAEPGQHVQFGEQEEVPPPIPADNVQFAEPEEVPPPIPADNNDRIGVLGWDVDLGMFDERYLFTMDELCFDEPAPATQGDNTIEAEYY